MIVSKVIIMKPNSIEGTKAPELSRAKRDTGGFDKTGGRRNIPWQFKARSK